LKGYLLKKKGQSTVHAEQIRRLAVKSESLKKERLARAKEQKRSSDGSGSSEKVDVQWFDVDKFPMVSMQPASAYGSANAPNLSLSFDDDAGRKGLKNASKLSGQLSR
jgi:hypothetical protein